MSEIKDALNRGKWKRLTPSMQTWFLKIKKAKRGVKSATVPARTLGSLYKKNLVMKVGDILIPTSGGEELYDWYSKNRKAIKA